MDMLPVELTDEELRMLDAQFPRSMASAVIGKRAEAVVRIYFRRLDPSCEFRRPRNGADLEVQFSSGRKSLVLEIKGTDASRVSWQQLKVSSPHSWRHLVEEGVPIYRVTNVFGKTPCITELLHERDFTLQPEPRWSFKAKRSRVTRTAPTGTSAMPQPSLRVLQRTSKYSPLSVYLSQARKTTITLTFAQLDEILGFPLPASAKRHQAFWANQSDTRIRPWARAWQTAGYRVDGIHLDAQTGWIRFSRV